MKELDKIKPVEYSIDMRGGLKHVQRELMEMEALGHNGTVKILKDMGLEKEYRAISSIAEYKNGLRHGFEVAVQQNPSGAGEITANNGRYTVNVYKEGVLKSTSEMDLGSDSNVEGKNLNDKEFTDSDGRINFDAMGLKPPFNLFDNLNSITPNDISFLNTQGNKDELKETILNSLGLANKEFSVELLARMNEYKCAELIDSPALGFSGNALQMKYIQQRVSAYIKNTAIDHQYLQDALFEIEEEYREIYKRGMDTWGLTPEHSFVVQPDSGKVYKESLTLDMDVETKDPVLKDIMLAAMIEYREKSDFSKEDSERFVTDYITSTNDKDFLKVTGPALQMKILSESIKVFLEGSIRNLRVYDKRVDVLRKISTNIDAQYESIYSDSQLTSDGYVYDHLHTIGKDERQYVVKLIQTNTETNTLTAKEMTNIFDEDLPEVIASVDVQREVFVTVPAISPVLAEEKAIETFNSPESRSLVLDSIIESTPGQVIDGYEEMKDKDGSSRVTPIEVDSGVSLELPDSMLMENGENENKLLQRIYGNKEAVTKLYQKLMNEALLNNDKALEEELDDLRETGDSLNPFYSGVLAEDEFDLVNGWAQENQIPTEKELSFFYGVSEKMLEDLSGNKFIDGKLKLGRSGEIAEFKESKLETLPWTISANNLNEIILIKKEIRGYIIENTKSREDLEAIVGTSTISNAEYRNYTLETGNDPLGIHKENFNPEKTEDYFRERYSSSKAEGDWKKALGYNSVPRTEIPTPQKKQTRSF